MAKQEIKKNNAKVVEEVEDVEIDVDDLELDGIEEVDADTEVEVEADEIEAELEEKPAKKAKKAEKEVGEKKKRQAPTGSTLASVQPLAENEVGAAYIAELCGVDAREVRMFLRANYRDMNTTKGQRYKWPKGSPEIQAIVDNFKAAKAGKAAAPVTKPAKAAKTVEVDEDDAE